MNNVIGLCFIHCEKYLRRIDSLNCMNILMFIRSYNINYNDLTNGRL